MLIKGPKLSGNLDPILVMGRDAFIVFLQDWKKLIKRFGQDYYIKIWSREQAKKEDGCLAISDPTPIIAKFKGYCNSRTCLLMTPNLWSKIDDVVKSREFGKNFLFFNILNPKSREAQKINPKIIIETERMIRERSASLERCFFCRGQYYL